MAHSLGVRFYDRDGKAFLPTGSTLGLVKSIDSTQADALLEGCRIAALCDVRNPLYGPDGAACVYAPQKGAGPEQVKRLDENLRAFAPILEQHYGVPVANQPGAGAAGGMGAGVLSFLHGTLRSGIGTLLELVGFEALLPDADFVLTGEGRLDAQSVCGKAVSGVAELAKKHHVPVIVLAGGLGPGAERAYEHGVSASFSTVQAPCTLEEALAGAEQSLMRTADSVLRLIAACRFPHP